MVVECSSSAIRRALHRVLLVLDAMLGCTDVDERVSSVAADSIRILDSAGTCLESRCATAVRAPVWWPC